MIAPIVDISNINTSGMSYSENYRSLEEEAKQLSFNIFRITEKSLKEHSNLSKVVILEHPPRYDKGFRDPMSIKPRLAKVANAMVSFGLGAYREKIVIGQHNLDSSSSDIHYARFQIQHNGRYDGVLFYGPNGRRDFTNSLKHTLKFALPDTSQDLIL